MDSNRKLELVTGTSKFYTLKEEWNSLLQDSNADHIFLTWEWISTWWACFGANSKLWIIVVRSADLGELLGLAPLYLHQSSLIPGILPPHRELAFIGANVIAPDHLDFIIRKGCEDEVAPDFMNYIYLNKNWDILRLDSLSSNSPVASFLKNHGKNWGNNVSIKSTAIITLPESWDEYHATLGKTLTKNLRRDARLLERDYPGQVTIHRANDLVESKMILQNIFYLAKQVSEQRGRKYTLGTSDMQDFHYQLAEAIFEKNWLRFYKIMVKDEIIAVLYCFNYKGVISGYQMTYSLAWKKYHPGQQILAHSIKEAINEKAHLYDFLRGDHSYTNMWTDETREDYYFKLGNSIRGQILVFLYEKAYQMRLWLFSIRTKYSKSH